jgi:hypothetical protein
MTILGFNVLQKNWACKGVSSGNGNITSAMFKFLKN